MNAESNTHCPPSALSATSRFILSNKHWRQLGHPDNRDFETLRARNKPRGRRAPRDASSNEQSIRRETQYDSKLNTTPSDQPAELSRPDCFRATPMRNDPIGAEAVRLQCPPAVVVTPRRPKKFPPPK